jgi:hypothetical protein
VTKALARETAFLLARSGRLTPDTIGLTMNAVWSVNGGLEIPFHVVEVPPATVG